VLFVVVLVCLFWLFVLVLVWSFYLNFKEIDIRFSFPLTRNEKEYYFTKKTIQNVDCIRYMDYHNQAKRKQQLTSGRAGSGAGSGVTKLNATSPANESEKGVATGSSHDARASHHHNQNPNTTTTTATTTSQPPSATPHPIPTTSTTTATMHPPTATNPSLSSGLASYTASEFRLMVGMLLRDPGDAMGPARAVQRVAMTALKVDGTVIILFSLVFRFVLFGLGCFFFFFFFQFGCFYV
jgi:hypothetical protein